MLARREENIITVKKKENQKNKVKGEGNDTNEMGYTFAPTEYIVRNIG